MSNNCPIPKIETHFGPENEINNMPFIQKEIKGEDNILYKMKIFKAKQMIVFNINKNDDFSEIIYKKDFTIEQLIEIDDFFKNFKDIENINTNFFKDFDNYEKKKIIISEKEYKLFVKFKFKHSGKIKEIIFKLDEYNINIQNILLKLCDKMKEVDKINIKLKELNEELEEQKQKLNNNDKILNKQINDIKKNENIINKEKEMNRKIEYEVIKKKLEDNDLKIKEMKEYKENQNLLNINTKNEIKELYKKINNSKIIYNILIFLIIMIIISIGYLTNKSNYIDNIFNNTINIPSINYKKSLIDNKFNNIENNQISVDYKLKLVDDKIQNISDFLGFQFLIFNKNYFNYLINEGIKKYYNKTINKYTLLYLASRENFKAKSFHDKCDFKNFTVTLVLTEEKKIFGGFTELKWNKRRKYIYGDKGFIFSINNNKIYYNKNKYKIYNSYKSGPCFDWGGFRIYSNYGFDNTKYNESNYFEVSGEKYELAGKNVFYIKDYAVFKVDLI